MSLFTDTVYYEDLWELLQANNVSKLGDLNPEDAVYERLVMAKGRPLIARSCLAAPKVREGKMAQSAAIPLWITAVSS